MCYQHRGFIREIPSLTGLFLREITNQQQIRGKILMCDHHRFIIRGGSSPMETMDHTRDEAKRQSTSDFNKRFTIAWAKLTISFFCCISNEAMGVIN